MSENTFEARSSSSRNHVAGGRQITRNRASYSCHTCRRRKVKCDKIHPICGNCMKNGSECVYDTATPKKNGDVDVDDEYNQHGIKRRRQTLRSLGEEDDDSKMMLGEREQTGLRGGSQAIAAQLNKLTNMIENLSKAKGPLPVEEMSRQLQTISQDVDLQNSVGSRASISHASALNNKSISRDTSPRRMADSSGDEFPVPAGNATDPVDPVGLNLGHLSLEDGRSRYVGTTYWAYISDEINELNQLLREQHESHEVPSSNDAGNDVDAIMISADQPMTRNASYPTDNRRPRYRSSTGSHHLNRALLFSGESPTAFDKNIEAYMLEDMPTRRQSDILYKGFMSGVHGISPVLHPPTILQSYYAFWDWYENSSYSGERCPDTTFIPLLYAIWHGGSVTISIHTIKAEFPNVSSRSELCDPLHEHVVTWLDRISFPRNPSLHGLVAFLITRTILSREEEPLASSLFISTVLRVAQTMGLHRDPAKFGIKSSEAETRRRIWWHIIHMDGVVSMSSGLPPLVCDESYWDVRETSEVKDTLLGTPQAEQYSKLVESNLRPPDNPDDPTVCGGNSMVNVFYLCARGKYVMARAVRRIMKIQLGTKPVTGRDMEELRSILVDLQFQLNSLINRIPLAQHPNSVKSNASPSNSSLSAPQGRIEQGLLPDDGPGGCSEQYHTPVLVAFHKWARILLSLFLDKAFCVAYQPFLKNARSRIWPTARQGALRHCHGFMEKFIALATDPDFQPFQWSWPGNHQPMHATMIMLIDLYERPNSPEALRSRAFIDKIFSISGPDGGVVGGEDGVTTARPLKDGGREAWDMMRRLREKAWQKAGLNPKQLWTEQAQIQAGVGQNVKRTPTHRSSHARRPVDTAKPLGTKPAGDAQLADFNRKFFEMTRNHVLPNPVVSSLRQESQSQAPRSPSATMLPRSSNVPMPVPTPPQLTNIPSNMPSPSTGFIPSPSLDSQSLDATLALANLATGSVVASPTPLSNAQSFIQQQRQQQQQPQYRQSNQPSPNYPIMSTAATSPSSSSPTNTATTNFSLDSAQTTSGIAVATSPSAGAGNAPSAPTPPSMMDPNLSFDWDQWDAVFGQQIPMADEIIELDPVAGGLGFGLFGNNDLGVDLFDHSSTNNQNNASNIGFGGGGGAAAGNEMATTPVAGDVWRDFETWQYQ
ncbi:C6 transcription factor, putative [Talaromyces stipitatus ATCC 10500]|uniref:C6 transcription factor, putative n=1 Tax=Talaromyces stipitatus (strain ATCC 10500 / CBS 375.48 / QM 6759 / NRRL 1006) TaxID=441959 RepID=B8M3G5_TALSN|nr:C6 transcription factor, putative [Talaromyces stipitatus ATCC 10500]EED22337.1 C6 transcription factor, putative [Talaromyces stipitatus ATCC 10500]